MIMEELVLHTEYISYRASEYTSYRASVIIWYANIAKN